MRRCATRTVFRLASMTIEAHGRDHEGANLDHSRDQQHRVRPPHADAGAPLHDERVLLPWDARVTS